MKAFQCKSSRRGIPAGAGAIAISIIAFRPVSTFPIMLCPGLQPIRLRAHQMVWIDNWFGTTHGDDLRLNVRKPDEIGRERVFRRLSLVPC